MAQRSNRKSIIYVNVATKKLSDFEELQRNSLWINTEETNSVISTRAKRSSGY